MKIYVLYHANCPDGFGAAFAAWLRFGDDAEYIPVNYGQPVPNMQEGAEVYILDFSYPIKEMDGFIQRFSKVVCLDHHETSRTELQYLAGIVGLPHFIHFNMDKSGAVLAWEYFHGYLPVPEFFLYLQDRDLWKLKLPKSREVSMALRSYPMDFMVWTKITAIVTQGQIHEFPGIMLDMLKREGVSCLRLTEQQVNIMAKNHRWVEFKLPPYSTVAKVEVVPDRQTTGFGDGGRVLCISVPVANATVFFSEVGEKLLEMYPDAPVAAYYLDRSDGLRQWGLRSRQDFDCSVIAKAFGGGGHKQASGFTQKL